MVSLGLGEIIGSFIFGRIQDKFSIKVTVISNLIGLVISFAFIFAFNLSGPFKIWLAILMTFTWGVQDAGLQVYIYCVLGF